MNLDKWKSVLLPREVYEEIKVIAKVEGRTISGQLRWIFSYWKEHGRNIICRTKIRNT